MSLMCLLRFDYLDVPPPTVRPPLIQAKNSDVEARLRGAEASNAALVAAAAAVSAEDLIREKELREKSEKVRVCAMKACLAHTP